MGEVERGRHPYTGQPMNRRLDVSRPFQIEGNTEAEQAFQNHRERTSIDCYP